MRQRGERKRKNTESAYEELKREGGKEGYDGSRADYSDFVCNDVNFEPLDERW